MLKKTAVEEALARGFGFFTLPQWHAFRWWFFNRKQAEDLYAWARSGEVGGGS